MKYKIELTGIHCSGCINLIKLSLEEANLENVEVDSQTNIAVFKSSKEAEELKALLNDVFSDLNNYQYFNLQVID